MLRSLNARRNPDELSWQDNVIFLGKFTNQNIKSKKANVMILMEVNIC